jgi:myo-inositol 2-dehydrogenase/D-chiro-inositol 1-dehydrogenase
MASEAVRIALVGAGRMGQVHLGALQRAEGVELAGVVDPYAQVREQVQAQGVPVYETLEQLLNSDRPDGVLVAAPSDTHPQIVELLARARMPTLCEKPVGVRAEAAHQVARVVEDSGILFQVGYWRRFVPELMALRERVAGGELGEIAHLACMQWDQDLPTEAFRRRSGGITVDMGVHEFDQTRWLVGQEFEWLTATASGPSTEPRPATDPDSATVLARLSGGTSVVVSLGRHFPQRDSCWLEIWGTGGHERVAFMWGQAGDAVFRDSMARQVQAFARAVRGEPQAGAGARDAIAALTVAGWAADALVDGARGQSPDPVSVP